MDPLNILQIKMEVSCVSLVLLSFSVVVLRVTIQAFVLKKISQTGKTPLLYVRTFLTG